MNILIFGARGRLGSELVARLSRGSDHVLGLSRQDADLTHPLSIARWINAQRPDVVINATAMNGMEQVDRDPHIGFLVNAAAPAVMARECADTGALFIHFSTDYVFSGSKVKLTLIEDDRPEPMGKYGWSKLAGEDAVRNCGDKYLIFRLSSIFGRDFRGVLDVVRQVVEKGRGGPDDPVQVLHQYCAPTSTLLIADAVHRIIKTVPREDWARVTGIYNLASRGGVWKRDYALYTLKAFLGDGPLGGHWSVVEGRLSVPRPEHTCLDSTRFEHTFGIQLPTWGADLDRAAREFAPHLPKPPAPVNGG
jgi:dTDP-4-dehydrorhamnose reductase